MSYSAQRIDRARSFLKGLDAILLSSRPNVTYVTGYTGSDAVAVYTESHTDIFVDSRNTLQAQEESTARVHEIRKRWEEIYEHLKSLGIAALGIESNVVDVDTFLLLKDLLKGIEMTPLGGQLKYLRAVKDPGEVSLIREAARISEKALDEVLAQGLVGRREADIAFDLECAMRRLGASSSSFEIIVASGPRSAMPHGAASAKIIRENEPVVIDFGCTYAGYSSDQTVTVCTGDAGGEFAAAYRHVLEAQSLAIAALAPGVKASSIDKLARDRLDSVGLGAYFGHSLGHGVGMEVHEMPIVSSISKDTLEEGMVITIEPGVYLPGKFGIRLEDMFVITDNSCKRITNIDKEAIKVIT
jgi:Xaa-Pro aminopeptidase